MSDQLTERARVILTQAQREARRWGHDYVGTEHLLLGIVEDGASVAAQVLEGLGATPERVRSAIEALVMRGEATPIAGELPLTPRARQALQMAGEAAGYVSQERIDAEHLLVGLLQEPEGVAGRVLRDLGLTPQRVAAEAFKIRVLQMTIVERAVRPVRAPLLAKRRMREELLTHLTAIFDEELAAGRDPAAAAAEAARRFGDPAELGRELDRAVTAGQRLSYRLERGFSWRAPETVVQYAARLALNAAALAAIVSTMDFVIVLATLGGGPFPWGLARMFAALVVATPVAAFVTTWASIKMRDAMWGAFGSPRSRLRVAGFNLLIALATLGFTVGATVVAGEPLATWTAFWPLWLATAGSLSIGTLLSARYEGPRGIRDTVWECLELGA